MEESLIHCLESNDFHKTAELINELIKLPIFTRLKGISYLGPMNFVFDINQSFWRWEHSIGTAILLTKILTSNEFKEFECMNIIISGLLHDIGHVFFSHTGEDALNLMGHFDHEEHTKMIMHSKELTKLFKKFRINIDLIDNKFKLLLSSHLDCDTLDGIPTVGKILNLETLDVEKVLVNNLKFEKNEWIWDKEVLPMIQKFWNLKSKIYNDYVESPLNRSCGIMLRDIIVLIKPKDIYITDNDLLKECKNNAVAFDIYSRILNKNFYKEKRVPKKLVNKKNEDIFKWALNKYPYLKNSYITVSENIKKTYIPVDFNGVNSISWERLEAFLNKHYAKEIIKRIYFQ